MIQSSPLSTSPCLLGLATSEAPHPASQNDIESAALNIFGGAEFDTAALRSVFANAGIERRTLAQPLEAYLEPPRPSVRAEVFESVAHDLLLRAATSVLPKEIAGQVTHVVSVCSSGIATPSLECRLLPELGLSPGVQRLPLFGLGCGGGVAGLQIATDLARSSPDALVLCLCVELTSLTLFSNDQSPRNFVACALFGDGAAAALVGRPRPGLPGLATLGAGRSHNFPGTLDLMGWQIRDEGWQVVFSQRIPAFVQRKVGPVVRGLVDPGEMQHLALHPGGARVLDAYRSALSIEDDRLRHSEHVLAQHGNMSAVTVFFVFEEILRERQAGPGLSMAVGPGFTANLLRFDVVGE